MCIFENCNHINPKWKRSFRDAPSRGQKSLLSILGWVLNALRFVMSHRSCGRQSPVMWQTGWCLAAPLPLSKVLLGCGK